MRTFFKNIPNNLLIWQMGRMNCGVFGVFPVEISAHILSLCVPSPLISIYQPLFPQKTKLLRHFKGKQYLGLIQPLCVRSLWFHAFSISFVKLLSINMRSDQGLEYVQNKYSCSLQKTSYTANVLSVESTDECLRNKAENNKQ